MCIIISSMAKLCLGDSSSSTQSCKRARGHKSIVGKYPTVDCRLCNKSVRNINSSLRHHSASHLSSTQSTTDNSKEQMKNMENRCFGVDIVMIGKGYRHKSMHHQTHIECRECHQLLSNIHMSLYRHAASHLHLAFYSCRLCPYKSKSWPPSNIKRHLREHHKSMSAVEYTDDRNECKTAVQNAMRNCFDYDYGRM